MATQGNSLAGALAATLQAIEVRKLVSEGPERSIAGREVYFDAQHPAHQLSRLLRNPECRFSHERYALSESSARTIRDAFDPVPGSTDEKRLLVPDRPFVSRLLCHSCDHEEELGRLRDSLDADSLNCPQCETPRSIRGFDLSDRLRGSDLDPGALDRELHEIGLRTDDVFGIASGEGETAYFVVAPRDGSNRRVPGASVVVAGLGNIGSYLAPHLARMPGVSHVVLCDPDHYEAGQEIGQDIGVEAVGRNKAEVQAERIRAIRPDIKVEAFADRIEELPLGRLKDAIAVSCLDRRSARLDLASRAWRVGSAFVDAAVGGGGSLLVRTNVYLPEPEAACFECSFEARDYETLEQVFPCDAASDRDAHNTDRAAVMAQPSEVVPSADSPNA